MDRDRSIVKSGTGTPEAAIRRNVPWKIARSLESADVSEVLVLSDHGQVVTPAQVKRMQIRAYGKLGLTWASIGLWGMLLGAPLTGFVFGTVTIGGMFWRGRHAFAIRRGVALISALELDAAEQLFRALEPRRMPARHKALVDFYLGNLAWTRGRFDEAAARLERAQRYFGRGRERRKGMHWICLFDQAQLAATMGDVGRAEHMRVALEEAPHGPVFELERAILDLLIALEQGTSAAFDDDQLYDLARTGLQSTRLGLPLLLVAWAFADRNDDDMADFLLAESASRIELDRVKDAYPALHAWMRTRKPAGKDSAAADPDPIARAARGSPSSDA